MIDPYFFSRATLKDDPALEALVPVLLPSEGGARLQTDHRLVWSLFAGDRDATRDFLFRRQDAAGRARFLILSKRRPNENSPLFDVETKTFAPALATSDRLGFSLYANPAVTHWRVIDGRKVRRRDDIVMNALLSVPRERRAEARPRAIESAGRAWLKGQAELAGFTVEDDDGLKIDGYDQFAVDRDPARGAARRGHPFISVSVLSFEGFLRVREPERFSTALTRGFGRARAFGCGLMLIRRA